MDDFCRTVWGLAALAIPGREGRARCDAARARVFVRLMLTKNPLVWAGFQTSNLTNTVNLLVGLCVLDELCGALATPCASPATAASLACAAFPSGWLQSERQVGAAGTALVELLLSKMASGVGGAPVLFKQSCSPVRVRLVGSESQGAGGVHVIAPVGAIATGAAISNALWGNGRVGAWPEGLEREAAVGAGETSKGPEGAPPSGPGVSCMPPAASDPATDSKRLQSPPSCYWEHSLCAKPLDFDPDEADMEGQAAADRAAASHRKAAVRAPIQLQTKQIGVIEDFKADIGDTVLGQVVPKCKAARSDDSDTDLEHLLTEGVLLEGSELAKACLAAECRRCLLRAPGPTCEQVLAPWGSIAVAGISRNRAPWHSFTSLWLRMAGNERKRRQLALSQSDPAEGRADSAAADTGGTEIAASRTEGATGALGQIERPGTEPASGAGADASEGIMPAGAPAGAPADSRQINGDDVALYEAMVGTPMVMRTVSMHGFEGEHDGVEFELERVVRQKSERDIEKAHGRGGGTNGAEESGVSATVVSKGGDDSLHSNALLGAVAECMEVGGVWRLRCPPEVTVVQKSDGTGESTFSDIAGSDSGAGPGYMMMMQMMGGSELPQQEAGTGIGVFRDFCAEIGRRRAEVEHFLEPAIHCASKVAADGVDGPMPALEHRVAAGCADGRELAGFGRFLGCAVLNGCSFGGPMRISLPIAAGCIYGLDGDAWLRRLGVESPQQPPRGQSEGENQSAFVALAASIADCMKAAGLGGSGADSAYWSTAGTLLRMPASDCLELLDADGAMEGTCFAVPAGGGSAMISETTPSLREGSSVVSGATKAEGGDQPPSASFPVLTQRQLACSCMLRMVRETMGPFEPVAVELAEVKAARGAGDGTKPAGSIPAADTSGDWSDDSMFKIVGAAAKSACGALVYGFRQVVPTQVCRLLSPKGLQVALAGSTDVGKVIASAVEQASIRGELGGMGAMSWVLDESKELFGVPQEVAIAAVEQGVAEALRACIAGGGAGEVDEEMAKELLRFWTGSTAPGPQLSCESLCVDVHMHLSSFPKWKGKRTLEAERKAAEATGGKPVEEMVKVQSSEGATEYPLGFPCRFAIKRYPTAQTCSLGMMIGIVAVKCSEGDAGCCTTLAQVSEAVCLVLRAPLAEAVQGHSQSGFLLR